jgi:2-polyprenyl-3-methyl-5-hydroxy-6-metoxy-1,4-benzoquinol methylase
LFPEKIVKDKDNVFSGEREIGTKLEDFSNDHINRYNFAKYFIRANDTVLDAACGVGYGSHLLADRASRVDAIDYSNEAVKYAKEHWQRDNIRYIQGNLLDENAYPKGHKYHVIVSFETIEHLKGDNVFVKLISERLLDGGIFIVSAPNADILKVEDNPWHERHYTPEEFIALVSESFRYVNEFTQIENGVRKGRGGDNNILVCSNKPWVKAKVAVYRVHTSLYRLKRTLLKIIAQ